MSMKKLKIDVMLNWGDKFYKTLYYMYCPLNKFDYDAMLDWVLEQLPSLRNKNDYILVFDKPL